jgi:aspartate-semialdehyde dehydrogenase
MHQSTALQKAHGNSRLPSFVEWHAEEGKRPNTENATSHLAGAEMIARREALGVVGIVTPWNSLPP